MSETPVNTSFLTKEMILQFVGLVLAIGVGWGVVNTTLASAQEDIKDLQEKVKTTEETLVKVDKSVTRLVVKQEAIGEQQNRMDQRISRILTIVERAHMGSGNNGN